MAEGKSEQLAYETQEKTAGNYVGEVLAELQARELQHVNRWSGVGLPHTAVKAEIDPHVTVTRARYSRGAETVFMIKFEGICT